MDRSEQVAAWLEIQVGQCHIRQGTRVAYLWQEPCRQVSHQIADKLHAVRDSFRCEVVNRRGGWREEPAREMIHDNPVHFLRHASIERP